MKTVIPLTQQEEDKIEFFSYEESEHLLHLLCRSFNANKEKQIHRYLNSKPTSLFGGWLGWDSCPGIGTLWYPQHEGVRKVGELWESVLQFAKNKVHGGIGREEFSRKVAETLAQQGIKTLYGVAEWADLRLMNRKLIGHRVVGFSVDMLPRVVSGYPLWEGYFFSEGLSYLFCITDDDFLFLAGSAKLISAFKKNLPTWREYILDWDSLK